VKRTHDNLVDCLRFFAALLVVLGHARALLLVDRTDSSHSMLSDTFYVVTGLGRQAVYVFFALSGYWVGGWIVRGRREGSFTWSEHLIRRLTRLWAVLVPTLLVVLVVDALGRHFAGDSIYYLGTAIFHGVAPSTSAHELSIGVAVGNVFFLQGHWVHTFGTDGPLWSLGYEFWYYLLFPLLLALWDARALRSRLTSIAAIAGCAVLAGAGAIELFPAWLVGVGAFWLAERQPSNGLVRRVYRLPLWVAGFATFVTCVACQEANAPAPLAALVDAVATSGFLVLASRPRRITGVGARLAATVGAGGRFSYTLYAVHLPLLILMAALLSRQGQQRLGLATLGKFGVLVVAALLVAYVMSLATERHTWRLRDLARRFVGFARNRGADLPSDAAPVQVGFELK
jgi:peptidoglycan/LPS O-acetylase OafA/YrhL